MVLLVVTVVAGALGAVLAGAGMQQPDFIDLGPDTHVCVRPDN